MRSDWAVNVSAVGASTGLGAGATVRYVGVPPSVEAVKAVRSLRWESVRWPARNAIWLTLAMPVLMLAAPIPVAMRFCGLAGSPEWQALLEQLCLPATTALE